MKMPTLRDVLWTAQDGCCWLCSTKMLKALPQNTPRAATLDHLWSKKQYGQVGDVGTTLLAHQKCNQDRGAVLPSDDDIRILISVYRRVPSWWLGLVARDAAQQAANARAFAVRSAICGALVGGQ